MRPLTFNEKRFVAAIYLAVLLFASGNHYLEWGLFGDSDRRLFGAVLFVGIIVMLRFLPGFEREMQVSDEARREAEMEAERMRDKSNDEIETERLRKAIGMPPNKSLERTHEE